MARFSDTFLDEVRARSDIVEVVSEYISLRKNGSRHTGLCPFHSEKTPSFSVDAQNQLYYCFGCHAGGNVFHFVMHMQNMTFPEAIEHLANRANMQLPEDANAPNGYDRNKRDRLYEALTQAARFYFKTLYAPSGQKALNYLRERGLNDATIRTFGLGATPGNGDGLTKHLLEEGFTLQELCDAGLSAIKDGRSYDVFRARALFPIFDPRGRVLGFGGRILGEGNPKYLNSAQTPVFNKRENVYGLNFLKRTNLSGLTLVEGYMDVVSLWQNGIIGCVATLGTAFTAEQARLLRRYGEITICYDGDEAGQRATLRALEIFEQNGVEARVIEIPGGQDPDDFVKANGKEAFMQLERMEPTQYRLIKLAARSDLTTSPGMASYAIEAAKIVGQLQSPVQRERYATGLATQTGYDIATIYEQMGRSRTRSADNKVSYQGVRKPLAPAKAPDRAQRQLISLMAAGRVPLKAVRAQDFTDPVCAKLFALMLENEGRPLSQLLDGALEDAERAAMVDILQEDIPLGEIPKMVDDYLNRMQIARLGDEIAGLTQQIATLSGAQRDEAIQTLMQLTSRQGRLKAGRKE